MLKLLHSKSLWSQVAKVRGNKPVIAAIAYANKDHLKLCAKDTLICDASDSRIATGATTHALLSSLAKRKVNLWHLGNLHAKVVRLSEHVVVGSANMTANSESLVEAAVLTDHVDAVGQVDEMLSFLLNSGKLKRIDRTFLTRIKAIPVMYSGGRGQRKTHNVEDRTPTCWVVGYRELSHRETEKSNQIITASTGRDEERMYFRRTLNAAKKLAPIQLGDSLILVHLTKKRVHRSVTVTGVFQADNHFFCFHEDVVDRGIAWERVQEKLQAAGLYNRKMIPTQLALDLDGAAIVTGMFR